MEESQRDCKSDCRLFRKSTDVLTDVTFFALFCFVAQADFKSVDFT